MIQAIEAIGFGSELGPQLSEALESIKQAKSAFINNFSFLLLHVDMKKQALIAKESKANASTLTNSGNQANDTVI